MPCGRKRKQELGLAEKCIQIALRFLGKAPKQLQEAAKDQMNDGLCEIMMRKKQAQDATQLMYDQVHVKVARRNN